MATDGGTIYIGRDNTLNWLMLDVHEPLAAARAAAINRALLVTQAVIVDSAADPSVVTGVGTDTLHWRLGHVPELVDQVGRTIAARLVVFAPDYPAGLVWADDIQVAIR